MVLLFSVIVFGLFFWCQAQSPCPGTFDYQNDGTGVIRLQPHGPVSSVAIRVNFTIAVRLVSSYVGRVEPINPEQALQRFNQGSTLTYRVLFPVTSPLPRLTSLVVNNRELCFGPPDIPGPGQYVSTITLQHMLYSGNGGSPGNVIYDNTVVNPVRNQENFASSNSYGPNRFSDSNGFSGTNGFDGSVPVNSQVFNVNDQNGNKGTYTYYTYKINRTNGGQQPGAPGQTIFFNEQTTQPAFVQRPQNQPDYNYFAVPPTQPPLQYITERITERPRPQRPQPPQWTQPPQPPPDYKPYTTESPRQPPQPDYNPYTTESARPRPQPDRPPPDYNPYTTQSPQPEQPPPDFNPYDTNNNGQGGEQNPNIPQVPPRLPGVPNLSNHGECGVIAGGNEKVPLIFNGQSYDRGDWPWLVAIYKRAAGRLDFICSGTLISHKHVVTAAHCMVNKNAKMAMEDIVVKVGAYNLEDWGDDITQQRTLEAAVIHESFNTSTLANDILVLTVDRAVEFNVNIRPACLWSGKTDLNRIVGASGVVAGWGRSEFGRGGHGEPRMARIPIVSTSACRASRPEFHKLTSSNTLCAGDRNGVGPCSGDSGGGLYILESGRWRLRGVVSLSLRPDSGASTCNLNEYLVFTDAAKYLKWVKDIVQTSLF